MDNAAGSGKMLPRGQNGGSGVALTPSETANYSMLQSCNEFVRD